MAFEVEIGTFSAPTSTGDQDVTLGISTAELVLLFLTRQNAVGDSAGIAYGIGAMDASNSFFTSIRGTNDDPIFTPMSCGKDTYAIALSSGEAFTSPTISANPATTRFGTNKFTLNWTTVDGSARLGSYIAFNNIPSLKITTFSTNTTTGNQSITGIGFKPDLVIVVENENDDGFDHIGASGMMGIGAGVDSSNRWQSDFASRIQNDAREQLTNALLRFRSGSSGHPIRVSFDLVSMDTDGFTINITTTNGNAHSINVIALKGVNISLSTLTQPTSTGNQSVTGMSSAPLVTLFQSNNTVAGTGYDAGGWQHSISAARSSSARFALFGGSQGASGPTAYSHTNYVRDKAIRLLNKPQSASAPNLNAEADFVSNNSDGFTVNWTTVDATAREILYIAFKETAAAVAITGYTVDGYPVFDDSYDSLGRHVLLVATQTTLGILNDGTRYQLLSSEQSDSVTEAASVADTTDSSLVRSESVNETATAADTLDAQANLNDSISETSTATDAPSASLNVNITVAESGTAAETTDAVAAVNDSVSEAATAADATDSVLVRADSVSESTSATDTPSAQANLNDTVSETGSATDTPSALLVRAESVAETGAAADTTDAVAAVNDSVAETTSAVDTPSAQASLNDSVSEIVSATDTLSAQSNVNDSVTESAAATDAPSAQASFNDAVAESVSSTDTTSALFVSAASVAESGSAADTTDAEAGSASAEVTETTSAADTLSAQASLNDVRAEVATASDTLDAIKVLSEAIAEATSATDITSAQHIKSATVGETTALTDLLDAQAVRSVLVAESTLITDLITTQSTINAAVAEFATMVDTTVLIEAGRIVLTLESAVVKAQQLQSEHHPIAALISER